MLALKFRPEWKRRLRRTKLGLCADGKVAKGDKSTKLLEHVEESRCSFRGAIEEGEEAKHCTFFFEVEKLCCKWVRTKTTQTYKSARFRGLIFSS